MFFVMIVPAGHLVEAVDVLEGERKKHLHGY